MMLNRFSNREMRPSGVERRSPPDSVEGYRPGTRVRLSQAHGPYLSKLDWRVKRDRGGCVEVYAYDDGRLVRRTVSGDGQALDPADRPGYGTKYAFGRTR